MVSHPFRKNTRKGWGTAFYCFWTGLIKRETALHDGEPPASFGYSRKTLGTVVMVVMGPVVMVMGGGEGGVSEGGEQQGGQQKLLHGPTVACWAGLKGSNAAIRTKGGTGHGRERYCAAKGRLGS